MMFSSLEFENGMNNSIAIDDKFINELKNYNKGSKLNYLNKEEYRDRINKLYNDIGMVKPIDNEINDVLYFNDFDENGIVINKKNVSLKQIWTEYRLLYNEKSREEGNKMENSFVLDNFDELYDRISKKVDGIDKYISDLNLLKKEIDLDNNKLNNLKNNFQLEKLSFENYRKEEMARLEKKEKELNAKLEKINMLMKSFENKINGLEDTNNSY